MLSNSSNNAFVAQLGSPKRAGPFTVDVATPPLAYLNVSIRGGLPRGALRRVREFVETHLDETVTIQALATVAGLSMYHFARAFKQSEGVTPHNYLVTCRVRRAQSLLA